MLQQGSVDDAK